MAANKKYWKNTEQLKDSSALVEQLEQKEFAEQLPVNEFLGDQESLEGSSTSRRDFLKYVGFSTAAASLAACEGPVIKSVPYVVQPEQIIPGIANYYATAIADGFDFGSVLIKTREGRPIKVENNPDAPTLGGANARVHASVLSMYDTQRLQGPKIDGEDVSWSDFHLQVGARLQSLAATGKEVVLLTQTLASPTTKKIIADFIAKYPNVKQVVFDTIATTNALDAFEEAYGIRALADYDFSQAKTIVSVGADILGDWQGGGYDTGYSQSRIPTRHGGKATMSKHYQFEANMSLSGANADVRVPATPSAQKNILAHLYAGLMGSSASGSLSQAHQAKVQEAVAALKAAGDGGVVVTDIQDKGAQALVLAINNALESKVMDVSNPRLTRQEKGEEVKSVIQAVEAGTLGGLITMGINPVFTLPSGKAFAEGFSKLDLSVSFSMKEDETASAAKFLAAIPHYLEAWGDYEFKLGHYALAQPTIRPLFDTLQFQDALLKWTGSEQSYYDAMKSFWNENILDGASWNTVLHDGFLSTDKVNDPVYRRTDLSSAVTALSTAQAKGIELSLYTKTGMGDGQQANNPWLQEFPDPITRVAWDNYLTISAADAAALGLKNVNVANGALNGSYAKVTVGKQALEVPVLIQPGQAKGSVGLALGYGARKGLQEEMQVGVNAYAFYLGANTVQEVEVGLVDGYHEFACTQLHNTLMGRGDIVKETTL
jgi:MoCo/4Fe-4S cofactor protein with predicted Tat translocation signal